MIDFEYHPGASLSLEILRADAAIYPERAQSLAREELAGLGEQSNRWEQVDAVACASTMTGRSLEHAGCDPAKITVIPYGAQPLSATFPTPRSLGPCRFLFVGEGIQRKGLHNLLRAWPALAARGDTRRRCT